MSTPEWIFIESQRDLETLINAFDWHDAFIREAHLASPSFRTEGGTAAAEIPPCVRVLIASGIDSNPALEILFDETHHLNVPHTDLEPHGEYRDWKCYWSFDSGRESTHCGRMRYRYLENSCVEHGLRYAKDEVYGTASDLIV